MQIVYFTEKLSIVTKCMQLIQQAFWHQIQIRQTVSVCMDFDIIIYIA